MRVPLRSAARAGLAAVLALAVWGDEAVSGAPLQVADEYSCRCPAETPKCVINVVRKEWICAPADAVGCPAPHRTYYCLKGQRCNGDGGKAPYCLDGSTRGSM